MQSSFSECAIKATEDFFTATNALATEIAAHILSTAVIYYETASTRDYVVRLSDWRIALLEKKLPVPSPPPKTERQTFSKQSYHQPKRGYQEKRLWRHQG